MEELFNNILVLVPVALLIFLRVFSENARKRSEKTRKEPAPAPEITGWAARQEYRRAPGDQSPAKKDKDPKPSPARRDLLGRLRNYLSGSLDQLMDKPEPLHFEEEDQRRLGQLKTPGRSATPLKPGTSSSNQHLLPGAMEESPAVVHEPASHFILPKQLQRMTPLKRAIVLAEVLGKPKSLQ